MIIFSGNFAGVVAQTLSATDIIRKTDEKFKGELTGYSVMTMTIVRPTWQRSVEFKSWSKEDDFALTLITAPAREKRSDISEAWKRDVELESGHKQAYQAAPFNDVAGMDGL